MINNNDIQNKLEEIAKIVLDRTGRLIAFAVKHSNKKRILLFDGCCCKFC